jgi:hypothetical protein
MSDALSVSENQRGETRLTRLARQLTSGGGKPGQGYPAVLISSTEDSLVRTSAWPVNGPVLQASEAVYGLSSDECCPNCGLAGFALRMSLDFYPAMTDVTSGRSSAMWMSSGMAWRGRYWTHAGLEYRNAAAACSLSAVLETRTVPRKYWLSAKAAAGILRRAAKRGKTLPQRLMTALEELASSCR